MADTTNTAVFPYQRTLNFGGATVAPTDLAVSLLSSSHLHRPGAETVTVPEEEHALSAINGTLARLNPLAPPSALPHGLDESDGSLLGVGAIVLAHDGLDSLGGLIRVIKGDGADIVVQHMCLDDTVEEVAADKAKLAVDSRGGATNKVPLVGSIVGKRRIGVLQEGDGN
jgi:hypothetical protein